MLDILLKMQQRAPIEFELVAVNLDQKAARLSRPHPAGVPEAGWACRSTSKRKTPTASSRKSIPEGKTMCSLCSRLRRGILYRVADELKVTKIALGHHRDDMLQTFFLNMFFGGKLKGMPPKLVSDDGGHIVIRPLAYVAEKDLIALGGAPRSSPSSPAPCAAARKTCSASRSATCCASGKSSTLAASRACSLRCKTWCPRT